MLPREVSSLEARLSEEKAKRSFEPEDKENNIGSLSKYRRLPVITPAMQAMQISTQDVVSAEQPRPLPSPVASPRRPSTAEIKFEITTSPVKPQRSSVVVEGLDIDALTASRSRVPVIEESKSSDNEAQPIQAADQVALVEPVVAQSSPTKGSPTKDDSPTKSGRNRPSTAQIKEAILNYKPTARRRLSTLIDSLDVPTQNAFRNLHNTQALRSSRGYQTFYFREPTEDNVDFGVDSKEDEIKFYQLSQADIQQHRKKFVKGLDGLSIFQSLRVCGKDGKLYGDRFDTIRHGKASDEPDLLQPGAYAFAIVSNKTEALNASNEPNLVFRIKPLGQGAHKGLINLDLDKPEAVGEMYIDESNRIAFASTKSGHFFHLLRGVDQLKVLRKFFGKEYLADENFHAFRDDKEYLQILCQRDLLRLLEDKKSIASAHSADDVLLVPVESKQCLPGLGKI